MEHNLTLFAINIDYLMKLDKPQEVFTTDSWDSLLEDIEGKFEENQDFEALKHRQLPELAPHFGVLYHQKSDIKLGELFSQDIIDIKSQNKTNNWRAKGIALIMTKLFCCTEEDLYKINKDLYQPTKRERQESLCDYNEIRNTVFKQFNKAKNKIDNENYEDVMKDAIKKIAKSLIVNGNFYNVDFVKYVTIFYYRFYQLKTFSEISEKVNIYHGSINNVLNKFYDEFYKAFDHDEHTLLCRKFENLYNHAFNELSTKDGLEKRNNRLAILKRFQHYFIAESLADFID